MAPNTATGLHFLDLPVEIRKEILGYLLTIQLAPRQDPVNEEAHFSACKDCRPLARRRDELKGSDFIQAGILLVCRQLHMEAQDVISDNQFVTVRRPEALGDSLLNQLRLGHWRVASGDMPKLRPVMMFSIDKGDWDQRDPPTDLLLFDLRDLTSVVRYLLRTCRSYAFGRVLDVCINKTHVPGYCNRNNAARKLFLDTIWPWLNKEIGSITLECNKAGILLHLNEPQVVNFANPRQLLEPVEMTPTLEAIVNGIQPAPAVPRTGERRDWNFRPAQEIWSERVLQVFQLSRVSEELIVPDLVRLQFCTAIICLNLAYTEPKCNYLQRTPAELNRQALRHIWSLELLPLKRDNGHSIQACCLYTVLASIEAWAQANRLRKAWHVIYLTLVYLRPSDTGPGWAQAQIRRGHMLKHKYMIRASRDGEDGNERWIKDPSFRARFFRGYTKSEIVPLIKQKFGEETGAFFRDAVPRKVNAWIRKHKRSLQSTKM